MTAPRGVRPPRAEGHVDPVWLGLSELMAEARPPASKHTVQPNPPRDGGRLRKRPSLAKQRKPYEGRRS